MKASSKAAQAAKNEYDAANRKIALEVLQRHSPTSESSARVSRNVARGVHRGGATAMYLNQREYEPGHPRNQRAYDYVGGINNSGVRRLSIDGFMRAGSDQIQWRTNQPDLSAAALVNTREFDAPDEVEEEEEEEEWPRVLTPPLQGDSDDEMEATYEVFQPRYDDAPPAKSHFVPPKLAKFRAALECTELDNDYHYDKREALWHSFDGNGTGYVSLAACNGGVMGALCNMWGKEGDELFRRYYRSYIRAWSDAKDAAEAVHPRDDDYVTRSEFRLLLVYLCCYATWYEVFRYIIDDNHDHRISKDEWTRHLPKIIAAGKGWADSLALASATAASFEEMDQNDGGFVDLQEFCEWVEAAEKRAGTEQGLALGVNEPIDRPSYGSHRTWHTTPLEQAGRVRARKGARVPFASELPEDAATKDVVPIPMGMQH